MRKPLPRDRTGTSRCVLIIDDDPGTCETIASTLRAHGVLVETADCGAAGLAMARSSRFDLLVLDLKLPDMLGTDFVRTLQRGGGRIPFVLVSGFLSTAMTVEAMKLGAVDVVEKPFEVDDLLRLLHSSGRSPCNQHWRRVPPGLSRTPRRRCGGRDRQRSAGRCTCSKRANRKAI